MADAYREDLAYIHNVGFGHLATSAALVVLDLLQQEGKGSGLVIDLGCGSGITAQKLCAAGYNVLGIDISEHLIAIARQQVPQGTFHIESFLTAHIPSCDGVMAIGECFNYLFDSSNTKAELLKVFQRIYTALYPGGLFIFDVAEPGRIPKSGSFRTYTEGEDWVVLMRAKENKQHKHLTRWITTFRRVGTLYRRDCEVHHLQLFKRSELVEHLQNLGFEVQVLEGYGTLQFSRGHIGFLACKPYQRD